ncbi:alpha-1-antiproteinase 2-like [Conger conger]|uniref:alpha-1-antiproteinase 2-like n=1 Tax=Conger conger TaxID=82655 RepID=UPI002A5A395B|nr:alpha-1-antiproteinase 2-like [Conger conger]
MAMITVTMTMISHHGNNDVSISANRSLNIYRENLDFAFRLYKHISAQPDSQSKNVFFSLLSVSVALAALSVGARGKTHQQLFEGLGFNSTEITTEEVNQAFQHILQNLNEKTDVNLSLGNALFIGQDFKPRPEFLESMKRYFESDVFSTDFRKTEEAKEQINKYVNEKTKGKISDLVQDVDPLTVMYIINYIYFKGKWQIPFDPKATKEHDFHVDDKTNVSVPMMYEEDYFHVYHDEDVSILQLHYNESVSMMLVLPEKGLQGLEEVVCKNHLQKWKTSMEKKPKNITYQVYVPKLSLKTSYQLKEILSEMGITDIFGDTAEDLTGISEESKLAVMHKATLDLDEAGATAAAATGIEVRATSALFPAPTPVLKFDCPFMVFVLNRDTRSIMFMGKIVNPAK